MALKKATEELRLYSSVDYPEQRSMGEWGGMPEYVSNFLKPFKTVDVEFRDGPLIALKVEQTSEASMFDMPEATPVKGITSLHVHFETVQGFFDFQKRVGHDIADKVTSWRAYEYGIDREKFAALIGQTVTDSTTYVWHPDVENMSTARLRYSSTTPYEPKYPIYIISKGRSETRLTAKALDEMGVYYRIVVEPQEQELYEAVIDFDKVLVAPENFSQRKQGSIPVRNFVWQHSIESGAARHWVLDDNIRGFYRLNRNKKVEVTDGTIFRAAEDFVDRYDNVGIAGMNYYMFAKHRDELPPFLPNRRIYSCILIKNDIDLRIQPGAMSYDGSKRVLHAGPVCNDPHWRGRYNEDTDLSIRAMKLGYCTVLFYAFLCYKEATMTMKGGNMDELYQGDGRLRMAESLRDQHPDICTIYHKFGIQRNAGEVTQRAQHLVDYSVFKGNKFKLKSEFFELAHSQSVDDYGMELKELANDSSPVSK
jgi:hypothetical protein